jgi:acyl carrier protein
LKNISNRVERVVKKHFPDGELGTDSLELMEFVMSLEDEFSINISDKQFADIKTVQDIVDRITIWADQANDSAE